MSPLFVPIVSAVRGDPGARVLHFGLVLIVSPLAPLPAQTIADSFADWSTAGLQGENGWRNGYYNLTADVTGGDGVYQDNEFIEFLNDPADPPANHWRGDAWSLSANPEPTLGPWTFLGRGDVHPNGVNSNPFEEHWVIRRWVSDVNQADAVLTWHMRKTNLNGAGVTGYLFLNGELLDSQAIAGGDGTGVTRDVVVDIVVGDSIDLALGPTGLNGDPEDGADGSYYTLTVSTAPLDEDSDGVPDLTDNCQSVANPAR